MKAITLNDSHDSKLLEMCKHFFPEYISIEFRMCCGEDTSDFVYNENIGFLDENGWTEIHWFEFCTIYLSDKILGNSMKNEYYKMLLLNNPIDYLYEQFKQLK